MSASFLRVSAAVLLLPLVLATAGCEDAVDPFIDSNRYFTIFGYLDTGLDTQFVRVIPLRQTVETDTEAQPLDATVTLTELQTGYTFPMRDSLIWFDNGRAGHVYYAVFHPAPGRSYLIEVERSDGARSLARTTVPTFPTARAMPPVPAFLGYTQAVEWTGIDFRPFSIEVWYRFARPQPGPFVEYVIPYEPVSPTDDGRLVVNVRLSADRDMLIQRVGPAVMQDLSLMGIGMRLAHPDSAWRPPDGVFDPEVLSQPGTFSNVANGFGFFGAANRYTHEWVLSPQVTRALGYRYPD